MSSAEFLGAFARIFPSHSPEALVQAFLAHHLTQVQLNLNTFGLPTIPSPKEVSNADLAHIGRTITSSGLALWGMSVTYNTARPDSIVRKEETTRAAEFIERLQGSGAAVATLCSGSRDPDNMWGFHPDTSSEAAWRDFRTSLDELLPAAESAGVLLAIEPEPANTVADVDRALRLQTELGADADRIGFILDPANLVSHVDHDQHTQTLERAFGELGESTICVHAKDTVPWAATVTGHGVVDYDLVARLYAALPARVPFNIQDAAEHEIDSVVQLIEKSLAEAVR